MVEALKLKKGDNQSKERFMKRDYSRRSCSFGSARGDSKQGSSKMPACLDDLSMSGVLGEDILQGYGDMDMK
jgi:hypothetical protein